MNERTKNAVEIQAFVQSAGSRAGLFSSAMRLYQRAKERT